jgi:hypothetical protein
LADAFEKFGGGDVAGAGVDGLGVVEGGAEEEVGLAGIPGIEFDQTGDGGVEIAHEFEAAVGGRMAAGGVWAGG